MARRIRRKRLWITLALLAVMCPVCGVAYLKAGIPRFYHFGVYSNALRDYYEQHGRWPPDVRAMEEVYSESDREYFGMPPAQGRPIYRSAEGLTKGPYVVFVERPPQQWYFRFTRYVLLTGGQGPDTIDPPTELKSVWSWELDDLIAEDDRRRQADASENADDAGS